MTGDPNSPNNKTNDTNVLIGFLKWLIGLVWDEDRWLGLAVVLTMIVVVAAIIGQLYGVAQDGFTDLATYIGKVLAISAISLGIVKVLRGSVYGHILVVFVMGTTMIGTLSFAAQFLSGDKIGFLTRSGCMLAPYSRGCPFSEEYSVALTDVQNLEPTEMPPEVLAPGNAEPVNQDEPLVTPVNQDEPQFDNPVYVQFAGALSRKRITKASESLVDSGWNVQGADRGGERTISAYGLNEVRFFADEDRAAALALADQYNALANWLGSETMSVRDLSDADFNPQDGLLEIWTSVR